MKKRSHVSASFNRNQRGDGPIPFVYPLVVSAIGHLLFLAAIAFAPDLNHEHRRPRSVIQVSMVSLKKRDVPAVQKPTATKKQIQKERQEPAKRPTRAKPVEPAPEPKSKQTVASTTKPKTKTSLKKKTFQSGQAVQRVIKDLDQKENSVAKADPRPDTLQSALERLRKKVGETQANTADADPGSAAKNAGRQAAGYNEQGRKEAERIDLYRLEIAFQIQKNWAFNEQLAGGDTSLAAAIVFKVMPNGEIRDLFFTDRSGNPHLDESAFRAIMKSNPVDSHPQGLNQPYVMMAIRFTPKGIR